MIKIKTIIRKEWAEVFKNRMVLFTVIFLPLLLTVIPLAILFATRGSGDVAGGLPAQYTAICPTGMKASDCFQVFLISQFMFMFMIIPVMIPTAISAYSIVGEKTTRSLEPLLATPITTMELLLGKGLSAAIPAVLATYAAFIIFLIGTLILASREVMLAMLDPRWLIAIFIVGPLLAVMAIFFSLIVSSRVNDPRVAEQLTAILIVPVLLVFFGQMAGLFLINKALILLVALIALVVDALLAYMSVQLFQRETILTRWK